MQALPYLEGAVQVIEQAVPYIYTSAAAYWGRQLYRDTISGQTKRPLATYLRPGKKPKYSQTTLPPMYRTGPTFAPRSITGRGGMSLTRPSRYRAQLGRRVGRIKSRRTTEAQKINNHTDKKVHSVKLIQIEHSTDEAVISARRGELVNVRGVKVRCQWNLPTDKNQNDNLFRYPLAVRWAVINPRANGGQTFPSEPEEFFISQDPDKNMTENFPTGFNYLYHISHQINRKDWGVVKQGQFTLGGMAQGADNDQKVMLKPSSMKVLQFYIPIKRQMRFKDDGTKDPETNLYFIWWYIRLGDPENDRQLTDAELRWSYYNTTYFTNPKPFT